MTVGENGNEEKQLTDGGKLVTVTNGQNIIILIIYFIVNIRACLAIPYRGQTKGPWKEILSVN